MKSVVQLLVITALTAAACVFASVASATTGQLVITSDTTLTEHHAGSIVIGADGVTLDCAGHSVTGGGTFGVLLSGRTGAIVKNCDVSGFFHGVGLLYSFDSTITGNTSHGNSLAGFVLEGGSNNVLSSNTADGNGWNGFQLSFPSNTTLENNVATNNGGTAGIAAGQSSGNVIRGNTSTDNANNGIWVGASSSNNTITGNSTARNGETGFGFGVGIWLEGAHDSTVSGNVASDEHDFGILVSGGSSGNVVRENDAVSNSLEGIVLYQVANNALVENVARGNGRVGIALNTTSGTTVLNNVSMENVAAGFDLLLSNSNTLRHNVAQRNGEGGFHLAASSNNELSQNVANVNGGVGFDVFFDSSSNALTRNGAHGNAVLDARDAGIGNTWSENRFGITSGL